MGWSGRAPASPVMEAGLGQRRQGARHLTSQFRSRRDRHRLGKARTRFISWAKIHAVRLYCAVRVRQDRCDGVALTRRNAPRTGRADFRHPACMGLSLSRGRHAILVVLCIPFFCSTRAASILPSRPHISIAVARSGGQGRHFFSAAEGLSLTDASTAAGCQRSGGWPRDDPRGACHWPRSIARTTLVFG
jgi:hypothetical protein